MTIIIGMEIENLAMEAFKYINGYNSNLVKKLIKTYKLSNKSKILDIGVEKVFCSTI